eukprot:TRINITY_DN2235_c0_g1_i1.p1 TRINITY_DN2235_c0_g1~~TRINITY_DN2235_c0_g1_i1.p1  ORF type:complete len:711 (-),score=95.70 TRINITY_DN2235_c0_g1_i1:84-2216(-)
MSIARQLHTLSFSDAAPLQQPYRKIPPTPHPGRKPFRPIDNIRLDPQTPQYHEVKPRTPTPTPSVEKPPTREHRRRHRKHDTRDPSMERVVAPTTTPSPNTKEELMLLEQEQELQRLRQGVVMLQRRCEQNRGIVGGGQLEVRVAHLARSLHALRIDNQRLQEYSGQLQTQLQVVFEQIHRRSQRSRSVSPTRCRLDFNAHNTPRCRSVSPALRHLPAARPMPPHPAAQQLKRVDGPPQPQPQPQPPQMAAPQPGSVPLSLQPILPLPPSAVSAPTFHQPFVHNTSGFPQQTQPDPRHFLGEALKQQAETLTALRQELEKIARPLQTTIPKAPPTPAVSQTLHTVASVPLVFEPQVHAIPIQTVEAPVSQVWNTFRVIDLTQANPKSHFVSPPKPLQQKENQITVFSPNRPRPPSYTKVTSPAKQVKQPKPAPRGPATIPMKEEVAPPVVNTKPTLVETSISAMKEISQPLISEPAIPTSQSQPETRFRFFDNELPKSPEKKTERPVRSSRIQSPLTGRPSDSSTTTAEVNSRRTSDGTTSSEFFSFGIPTNRLNATIDDDLSPSSDLVSPRTENTKRSRSPYRSPSAAEINSAAVWLKGQYEAWERPGLSWTTRDALRRREITQSAANKEREVTVQRANSRSGTRSNTPVNGASGKSSKSKGKRSKRKKSTKKENRAPVAQVHMVPVVNNREALWAELRLPVPIFSPSK